MGYKKMTSRLLAEAIDEARQVTSKKPKTVVRAITSIQFLGSLLGENCFGLAGYDQGWSLQQIGFQDLVRTALERLKEKPIQEAIIHHFNLNVGDMLRRKKVVKGWPSKNPLTQEITMSLYGKLVVDLESLCSN